MIRKYKTVSIIYGGSGRKYADVLNSKIESFSEIERYPLSSKIIMDSILTTELLSNVISLFKESEFCVAFLTADDCLNTKFGTKYRLRQNVIFELGMALVQLGRERCLILSDFDIHSESVELPSDINSLEIRQFNASNFQTVIDDIISKLLQFSKNSISGHINLEQIPQYDRLLTRKEYYVDYENIFVDDNQTSKDGVSFFSEILTHWYNECASLPHFDERCIYLFERIGFLPIFGQIQEVNNFMTNASLLVSNYKESDINYYGRTDILNFTKNLASNIIEYTRIKRNNFTDITELYENLLDDFLFEEIPKAIELNPLIIIVYYDYLGLTYLRLSGLKNNDTYLQLAQDSFNKALEYVNRVDMSMQMWTGFLTYNIARTYAAQKNTKEATKYYKKAIKTRERWLKNAKFNVTVRNALSYEYFIAKINYIDMCSKYELLKTEEVLREYDYVENELNTYSDVDDKLNQLTLIRKLLSNRKK